jgi:hypothetical protein
MTLDQIELFHIRMPLVSPFGTSFGMTTDRDASSSKHTATD